MILFRLIKDGKVVGYEKHTLVIEEDGAEYYSIRHMEDISRPGCAIMAGRLFYINHDRKDRYTGIEVDGVKLFERDEVEVVMECTGKVTKYNILHGVHDTSPDMECDEVLGFYLLDKNSHEEYNIHYFHNRRGYIVKQVGIQGVTNDN